MKLELKNITLLSYNCVDPIQADRSHADQIITSGK